MVCALFDIANNGTEELIIGVNFGEKYIISTLYSYDNDSVHCAYMGPDGNETLYEMGTYKVYIEMRGAGVFEYYQFKEDLIQAEFVIGLTQSFIDGKYYKNAELNNSNETEITEEFRKIREQYEKNPIELEWQKLSGYDKDS